ncbi:MAG: ABC transporter permease [Acidobacteriia bacterium]|nr:ABC transporter permease [Terriglobia bacterium]
MRTAATIFLISVFATALFADYTAPYPFAAQFRELPNAAASGSHLLGTDALGRDRLSRLLYGARLSMLLAPAAALGSVLLALGFALLAAMGGPWCERLILAAADLFLSLPLFFLLLAARALLPLHTTAETAAIVMFGLLAGLGWAGPARVMVGAAKQFSRSDFVLFAKTCGHGRIRIALVHIMPNILPVAKAQFLIATPSYLLAEASLGLLGLGIPEPVPSWGSLLRELESVSAITANPWILTPALCLFLVVAGFHMAVSADKTAV